MKIEKRPWRPQDLLDDLQSIIDEEPDRYLNTRRSTLCMARDYLKEYFLSPPNTPLTLDQLREMDGEKIYVHYIDGFYTDEDGAYFGKFEQLVRECNGKLTACELPLEYYEKTWLAYRRNPEEGDDMIESHSEAEILKGCIALMQELTGRFEDYLDFMNIVPENDEERFVTNFTYFGIVQRLLLWKTSHSGGTSTMEKCQELGFDPGDMVCFEDERYKDEVEE